MKPEYKPNSLTLTGAVSMGTGMMIGAGIFAISGQVALFLENGNSHGLLADVEA